MPKKLQERWEFTKESNDSDDLLFRGSEDEALSGGEDWATVGPDESLALASPGGSPAPRQPETDGAADQKKYHTAPLIDPSR